MAKGQRVQDERRLDPGEFYCSVCGRISGPHDKDGMGECPECAEKGMGY